MRRSSTVTSSPSASLTRSNSCLRAWSVLGRSFGAMEESVCFLFLGFPMSICISISTLPSLLGLSPLPCSSHTKQQLRKITDPQKIKVWYAPYEVQAAGLAEDFRYNLSTTLLNDGQAGGRAFDLISNPAQGPDWISGGAFFLRSRRQPQLYWCVHQSYVHLSTDRRSKFRIDIIPGDGEEDPKGKKVFILSDRVMVTVVQETHSGYLGDKKYVGVEDFDSEKTSRLALVSRPHPFTFDELVRSLVGVRWEEQRDAGGNVVEQRPTLAPMSEGGAEEWELC